MKRSYINELVPNSDAKVCGFVDKVRRTKNNCFVVIRDRTGCVQVYIDIKQNMHIANIAFSLTLESTVEIIGHVSSNPAVKNGGIEILPESLTVISLATPILPINAQSSPDTKMDWRYLDLRSAKNRLIFELTTIIEYAMREYWINHGFIEIHTPKLMGTCSESGSELFKLDYFGKDAFLSQSPQFYKQMAMNAGFEKIFEIGPAFRANPSFTSRHETEFISVDAEISWIESHEDIMKFEEEWIAYFMQVVKKTMEKRVFEFYDCTITIPTLPFPRVTFDEAKRIIHSYGFDSSKDNDLSPDDEKILSKFIFEKFGHDFVFVTDYPVSSRPFYHMRNENNPSLTKSFDLLYRGLEITTGAQREHRYDILKAQIVEKQTIESDENLLESLTDYLHFFENGSVPHGGYGFGIARLVAKMLNLPNIKSVTFLSRNPKRITP